MASVKGQRGAQYWAVAKEEPPDSATEMQQRTKPADTSTLSLSLLASFAVAGNASLVDVGANHRP